MRFAPGNSLASDIISLLMAEPALSAAEIRTRIIRDPKKQVTIQAIYKELRRLQRETIAFKSRGKFLLSLPWLLQMRSNVERSLQRYSDLSIITNFLPEVGCSEVWRFSDILAMDRLVVNLIVTMLRQGEEREIYHWDPYPWYAVFHTDLAAPFLEEFRRNDLKAYGILGARSPISSRVVTTQRDFGHTWWIGTPPFSHREDTAVSIKYPYILSIRYPEPTLRVFRDLFAQKNPFTSAAVSPFHVLLSEKLTYRVTLSNNPSKAKAMTRSFRKVFGLSTRAQP